MPPTLCCFWVDIGLHVGAFLGNFHNFGLHFQTPGRIWASQWCSEGRLRSFYRFWVRFGGQCWFPFGRDFGLSFQLTVGCALGALSAGSRTLTLSAE